MKLTMKIEETGHLAPDDVGLLENVSSLVETASSTGRSLDELLKGLRWALQGCWYVYKGGHHIAIHKAIEDPRRIAIITEE